MVMSLTFVGTSQTHFAAQAAKMLGHFAVARHHVSRQATNRRAVRIQRYTPRHHFDVVFLQALCKACVARYRAGITGINTFLIRVGYRMHG